MHVIGGAIAGCRFLIDGPVLLTANLLEIGVGHIDGFERRQIERTVRSERDMVGRMVICCEAQIIPLFQTTQLIDGRDDGLATGYRQCSVNEIVLHVNNKQRRFRRYHYVLLISHGMALYEGGFFGPGSASNSFDATGVENSVEQRFQ